VKYLGSRCIGRAFSFFLPAFIVFFLSLTATAQVNNYYVSPAGSDSGDGSQARPWLTLAHATSAATIGSSGTIIHFAPGTYTITSLLVTTKSGKSDSARLIYQSDSPQGAHWVFNTGQQTAWIMEGDYVDLVGFDITSATGGIEIGLESGKGPSPACNDSSYSHLGCGMAQFNRILNNYIHDVGRKLSRNDPNCDGQSALEPGSGSHDGIIDGNKIVRNGAPGGGCDAGAQYSGGGIYGIYMEGYHWTVTNNIIGDGNIGIHAYHNPCQNVYANNVIFHNWYDGIILGSSGAGSSGTIGSPYCGVYSNGDDYNSITNNLLIRNGYGCDSSDSHHGADAIRVTVSAGHNKLTNNYLAGNFDSSCNVTNPILGTISQSGNIKTTTYANLLVNYKDDGTGDYHLTETSPAVGAGAISPAACAPSPGIAPCVPSVDIEAIVRPSTAPSIGAYEFASANGAAPAAPVGLTASVQ
jgi:hypothetical protein